MNLEIIYFEPEVTFRDYNHSMFQIQFQMNKIKARLYLISDHLNGFLPISLFLEENVIFFFFKQLVSSNFSILQWLYRSRSGRLISFITKQSSINTYLKGGVSNVARICIFIPAVGRFNKLLLVTSILRNSMTWRRASSCMRPFPGNFDAILEQVVSVWQGSKDDPDAIWYIIDTYLSCSVCHEDHSPLSLVQASSTLQLSVEL